MVKARAKKNIIWVARGGREANLAGYSFCLLAKQGATARGNDVCLQTDKIPELKKGLPQRGAR